MRNFAGFWTTSNFDGKYLWNRWRYSKSDKYIFFISVPPTLCERRSVKFFFTNHGDLAVKSYPPKPTFLKDYISAPKGFCTSKFLHVLGNDQVLLVHPHRGLWSSLQFFLKGVENWRKMWHIRACSFWRKESTAMKVCHMTGHKIGMITYVQILGGPQPRNFGVQKSRKFGLILDNFWPDQQQSLMD